MTLPKQIEDKIFEIRCMILQRGALDEKTKVLLAIATSVSCYCAHCHGEFKHMARMMGLTPEQIEEAEAIGLRMRKRCQNDSWIYRMNNQGGVA